MIDHIGLHVRDVARATEFYLKALNPLGTDPIKKLVTPRVLAALVMMPILTIFSDAIAVFGGYVVAVTSIGVSTHTYVTGLHQFFYYKDLFSGLLKAVFFGGIIGMMGCFHGFATEGGAEGVGLATTRAVVASCVLVLISDYVLANVLFRFIFAQ